MTFQISDIDMTNITFNPVKELNIENLKYKVVPIKYQGKSMIIQTKPLKSFGVQNNKFNTNDKTLSMSLLLDTYPELVEFFHNLTNVCAKELVSIQKEIGKNLSLASFQKDGKFARLNPLNYMKNRETNEYDFNKPVLNVKLMKNARFFTGDTEITDMSTLRRMITLRCALYIQSIYIGSNIISLQIRLLEGDVSNSYSTVPIRLLQSNRDDDNVDEEYF